ncbi:MAG: glycosyltransferase, partial [Rhodospirillales bacterium]
MLGVVRERRSHSACAPVRIFFPGDTQAKKGYQSSIDCAQLLGGESGVQTVLRFVASSSTPSELAVPPADLPDNASLVEGGLSNDAFGQLFTESDIVVLPYSADGFRNRTSGLLTDALAYGLPAVVVEGTWLANHVRAYQCGVVVPDASAEALAEGVLTLVKDIEGYSARTKNAAERYFVNNSWAAMADFLLKPFRSRIEFPKVAGIDLTPMGGISATSRVKEVFFRGWPKECFHWVNFDIETRHLCPTNLDGSVLSYNLSDDELIAG